MTEALFETDGDETPVAEWERDAGTRALDDLFVNAAKYQSTDGYQQLLKFITRFHYYAPFNAMLVYIQKPGAKYVLPAYRWKRDYGRTIKPAALPIVILQTMGPVMFVFDVSETEGDDSKLPTEVVNPFAIRSGKVGNELSTTMYNAARDGIRVSQAQHGSQLAGSIGPTKTKNANLSFGKKKIVHVPLRYELILNGNHEASIQYATLVHELAHLYCGHLGTPNTNWWPDRRGLPIEVREFEAESVTHLVCQRMGIETTSDQYLAGYYRAKKEVPAISLDRILVSARLIEEMGRETQSPRKESK
jgi:hypothetical protein